MNLHSMEYAMKHLTSLILAATLASAARAENPVVVMETSKGTIKIELLPDKSPITVKNFLNYVDDKFYDDTVFHRVIDHFMIQGGGYQTGVNKVASKADFDAKEKATKDPIRNE